MFVNVKEEKVLTFLAPAPEILDNATANISVLLIILSVTFFTSWFRFPVLNEPQLFSVPWSFELDAFIMIHFVPCRLSH